MLMIAPILAMILTMLGGGVAGWGAKKAGQYGAQKLASSAFGKMPAIAKLLGSKKAATIGGHALGFGGFGAGMAATDVALGHSEALPPPVYPSIEDVQWDQSMPFAGDQRAGIEKMMDEAQLREILNALGVDPQQFLAAGGTMGGLV